MQSFAIQNYQIFRAPCMLVLALLLWLPGSAQIEVRLDSSFVSFDGGRSLPAGKEFSLLGTLPAKANGVRVEMWKGGKIGAKKYLFKGSGEAMGRGKSFKIKVGEKLLHGYKYDFRITFTNDLARNARKKLLAQLRKQVVHLIDSTTRRDMERPNTATLREPSAKVLEVDKLIRDFLDPYIAPGSARFPAFPKRVRRSFWEMNELIRLWHRQRQEETAPQVLFVIEHHIKDMEKLVMGEVEAYLAPSSKTKVAQYEILKYPAKNRPKEPEPKEEDEEVEEADDENSGDEDPDEEKEGDDPTEDKKPGGKLKPVEPEKEEPEPDADD